MGQGKKKKGKPAQRWQEQQRPAGLLRCLCTHSPPCMAHPGQDPNTGRSMLESDAIIAYLFEQYGDGKVGRAGWLCRAHTGGTAVGRLAWRQVADALAQRCAIASAPS